MFPSDDNASGYSFEETLSRLQNNDPTFHNVLLFWVLINDLDFETLSQELILNKTVKSLSLQHNHMSIISLNSLSESLIENSNIRDLYLSNQLGDHGSECIARVLKTNTTLRRIYLGYNSIQNVWNLSISVSSNTTLIELYLSDNCIQDSGALELAKCILKNSSLRILDLNSNLIGNNGAIAFATSIRFNNTLSHLYLEKNKIEYIGSTKLLESLRRNHGLRKLKITGLEDLMRIQNEINTLIHWNVREKDRNSRYRVTFPWSYKDYILLIILVLNEVDIYPDLIWRIVNMLKIKDIVDDDKDVVLNFKPKYIEIGKTEPWWGNITNLCSCFKEC